MFRLDQIILFAACLFSAQTALAQGNIDAGAKLYRKCLSCHMLEQTTNKMGPHLVQILGRPAGSVKNFPYSPAMTAARQDGLIWTEENLRKFLASPKAMIPGTTMRFWGLWDGQLDDLLAYIESQTPATQ